MPFPTSRRPTRGAAALAVLLIAAGAAVVLSCSSDPDGPVGSDLDLLGSQPGDVFQDTIGVFADTVLQYDRLTSLSASDLEFGRSGGYTRAIIINIDFSGAGADTLRTVDRAELRLAASDITGAFPARFYRLRAPYAEGDRMASLDTLAVIPDPESGSVERSLQSFPITYPLPADLVQGWVRGDTLRSAIAILYTDDVNDRIATFKSRENEADKPQIRVYFDGGFQTFYYANADAVFVRPQNATSNLIISDGYIRRVYFRVRLDELAEASAVHTARVRFHIVPGSLLGTNTTAVVYIPNSPDPASDDFLTGQLVTEQGILDADESVEFPLTNSIFLTLQGSLEDNGFVVRFENEGTELRQVEFYGSAAMDTLRPRVFITSSTPADFDP
jgi:hypothetical protein